MKIQFEIDTAKRTFTADVSSMPTFEGQYEAMRKARLYAGLLFPHVVDLEFLKTPEMEAAASQLVVADEAADEAA